jgi:phenylacetate-CoA ligase
MDQALGYAVYSFFAKLRGEETFSLLPHYRETQWWKPANWERYHQTKLADVVLYARTSVPFYRRLAPASFNDLPIIEKAQLQRDPHEFLAEGVQGSLTKKTTGGSTGMPVTIYKDRTAMQCEQAATLRSYEWAGVIPGSRQGRFWGIQRSAKIRQKDRIKDRLLNRRRISAFNQTDEDLECFLHQLERFRPHYLYGYASVINEFARVCKQRASTKPPLRELRSIITTSEVLSDEFRSNLREVFGVPVFNEYGCGEVGTIAHECEAGSLHLNSENLFVEIVNDAGHPVVGEDGHIVLTELNNKAQPLLRYRVGDYGKISGKECSCGRGLPVLDTVYGRAGDFVLGNGGARYHPMFFFYIFEGIRKKKDAFEQFQIIQSDRSLLVRFKPGAEYQQADNAEVIAALEREFGDYFTIQLEAVAALEREPSGKMRVVKRISPQ